MDTRVEQEAAYVHTMVEQEEEEQNEEQSKEQAKRKFSIGAWSMEQSMEEVIERESMEEVIERESNESIWTQWKEYSKTTQEVEVLDLVISRVQWYVEKVSSNSAEHEVLQSYHRLAVELSGLRGLDFNILAILEVSLEKMPFTSPLPSADIVHAFLGKLGHVRKLQVPGFPGTLDDFGNKQYLMDQASTWLHVKEEDRCAVTKALDSATEVAQSSLKELENEFSRFPLLSWFLEICNSSIYYKRFGVFTYEWEATWKYFQPSRRSLRCLVLGEVLVAAVQTECISTCDIRCTNCDMALWQCEVLPMLCLELTRLRAVKLARIGQIDRLRGNIIALLMTCGITFGDAAANYFRERFWGSDL